MGKNSIKLLMHNVSKWLDTLKHSCSKCCKIFKVCLTILRQRVKSSGIFSTLAKCFNRYPLKLTEKVF